MSGGIATGGVLRRSRAQAGSIRAMQLAVGVGAVALGVVVAVVIVRSGVTRGHRVEYVAIDVLGGWLFIVAGMVAAARPAGHRLGVLLVATGFSWLLTWLRWDDRSAVVQTAGLVLAFAWAAVLAHLALAFPSGRLPDRRAYVVVLGAYIVAAPVRLGWMVLADPHMTLLLHPAVCHSCPPSAVATGWAPEVARALRSADQLAAGVIAAGVCTLLLGRWRAASPVARRALTPVGGVIVATALVIMLSTGASAAGLTGVGRLLEWLWDACVVALPVAFLVGVLRTRLRGGAGLARALDELERLTDPRELAPTLSRALGDPTIQLVYWLPESERYVDVDGRLAQLPRNDPARGVTPMRLNGRPVAALVHDASLLDEPGVVRAAGRAAALWLERARLEAERNARLIELRESRARLVEAADAERRRIERDLHDGAQQRLAALLLQAKLRRRDAAEPEAAGALLDDLEQGLAAALAELRALAAGILPPVLTDHGLPAAVEELAARTPVALSVDTDGIGRLPSRVEAAGYFVVAEAVANVIKHAHAEHVAARIRREDGKVIIEVADDGKGGATPTRGSGLRGLADRVAALDGRLTCTSPDGGGTVLRAEIPCES